jgi:PPOX class probable FMN-dependent enzyme
MPSGAAVTETATAPGVITDLAALEALYGPVLPSAVQKVTDHLTEPYRAFIAASPFVILATQGPNGIDVTPRGDPAGFVAVEDARTLLIPDRRGNNRLDSMRNILADPRVGLLFLIPGVGETLRVTGRAEIRADTALTGRFVMQGKAPATVLRIRVERVFYHCQKALSRSRLWEPEARLPRGAAPTVGTMLAAAVAGPIDAAAQDAAYDERQKILY